MGGLGALPSYILLSGVDQSVIRPWCFGWLFTCDGDYEGRLLQQQHDQRCPSKACVHR